MKSYILNIIEDTEELDGEEYVYFDADLTKSGGEFIASGTGDTEADALLALAQNIIDDSTARL